MPIPTPLPAEGYAVPLRATFTGIRNVPLLAVAHNNLTARFVLFPEHLDYRVLFRQERPYTAIESIDASQRLKQIEVAWRGKWLTLTAGFRKHETLLEVLQFFADKDLPLTENARQLLTSTS